MSEDTAAVTHRIVSSGSRRRSVHPHAPAITTAMNSVKKSSAPSSALGDPRTHADSLHRPGVVVVVARGLRLRHAPPLGREPQLEIVRPALAPPLDDLLRIRRRAGGQLLERQVEDIIGAGENALGGE